MLKRNRSNESRLRRLRCAESNLCLICGKPLDRVGYMCTTCLKHKSEHRKALRKTRQAEGKCLCGRPIEYGKSCNKCHEKYRQNRIIYSQHQKEKGLCPGCSKPVKDTVYCTDCSQHASAVTIAKYYNRKSSKLCVGCGKPSTTFRCSNCAEIHKKRSKEQWKNNRLIIINHYGGKCNCCGESNPAFLEIDHIHGGGGQHRKIIGGHITSWVIQNNFPDTLRLLCANCNRGTSRYKVCPHHQKPSAPASKNAQRARLNRLEIILHYGGKCNCCGESNPAFLEFDHINNDGSEHRKTTKIDTSWIKRNNCPDYLQLLCANCNKAKGLYGKCPHSIV